MIPIVPVPKALRDFTHVLYERLRVRDPCKATTSVAGKPFEADALVSLRRDLVIDIRRVAHTPKTHSHFIQPGLEQSGIVRYDSDPLTFGRIADPPISRELSNQRVNSDPPPN